jgi:tyrosyl-tRNA synthetase
MLLKHLQLCGHKPIILIGGATGMVGDPSGKSAERNLLDEATLRRNQEGVRKQLEQFVDFTGPNAAEIVNNYDWFKDFSFLGFLRDVGKHITINYMMAKDSVKKRLEGGNGLSFTEFSYQLLQGYDFFWLNKEKGAKLQMGGSDQWGNITTGTELIRRMGGGDAYALTCPLVTKADGSKFGKSEKGNVWLDAELTSPYQFYQFWINCADEDAPRLIRVFTLFSKEKIEALEAEHAQAPHLRVLQNAMAEDITVRVHGREAYEKAAAASRILFDKKASFAELETIDLRTWHDISLELPCASFSKEEWSGFASVADVLLAAGVVPSKGEATRAIQGGGFSVNKIKLEDAKQAPQFQFLHGKYLLVQKGKKDFSLIALQEA